MKKLIKPTESELSILQILWQYGPLSVRTVKENETQQNLLSEFLDATYRGSASTLVMQALGQHKSSKEELQQIKEFIANLESKK